MLLSVVPCFLWSQAQTQGITYVQGKCFTAELYALLKALLVLFSSLGNSHISTLPEFSSQLALLKL